MTEQAVLQLDHTRLGRLEIPSEAILHVEGLPGFADVRRLAVIEHDRPGPFAWLLAIERPDLAFVVIDPRRVVAAYDPQPHTNDLRAIGAGPGDEVDMLAIVNLTAPGRGAVNLAAPIIANPETRRAIQAILPSGGYSSRTPLAAEPSAAAERSPGSAETQIESNPQR